MGVNFPEKSVMYLTLESTDRAAGNIDRKKMTCAGT